MLQHVDQHVPWLWRFISVLILLSSAEAFWKSRRELRRVAAVMGGGGWMSLGRGVKRLSQGSPVVGVGGCEDAARAMAPFPPFPPLPCLFA